jgi:hypothetical protein
VGIHLTRQTSLAIARAFKMTKEKLNEESGSLKQKFDAYTDIDKIKICSDTVGQEVQNLLNDLEADIKNHTYDYTKHKYYTAKHLKLEQQIEDFNNLMNVRCLFSWLLNTTLIDLIYCGLVF